MLNRLNCSYPNKKDIFDAIYVSIGYKHFLNFGGDSQLQKKNSKITDKPFKNYQKINIKRKTVTVITANNNNNNNNSSNNNHNNHNNNNSSNNNKGSLGITSKNLKDWLGKLELRSSIEFLQKAVLLGTAKIVRKVLET